MSNDYYENTNNQNDYVEYQGDVTMEENQNKVSKREKFRMFFQNPLGRISIIALLYLIVFTILFLTFVNQNTSAFSYEDTPMLIYFGVSGLIGWRTLNMITREYFIFLSFFGIAVYVFIKGILSIFIGFFIAPYKVAMLITNHILARI